MNLGTYWITHGGGAPDNGTVCVRHTGMSYVGFGRNITGGGDGGARGANASGLVRGDGGRVRGCGWGWATMCLVFWGVGGTLIVVSSSSVTVSIRWSVVDWVIDWSGILWSVGGGWYTGGAGLGAGVLVGGRRVSELRNAFPRRREGTPIVDP